MKIVTSEQMRRIEQECARGGLPTSVLMENAGKAVAEQVKGICGLSGQHILCLIGPGNNGGDGLVAARYLHDWGARVTVYLCAPRPDADTNLALVKQRPINIIDAAGDSDLKKLEETLSSATCILDAILGTGKVRPFQGLLRQVMEKINEARQRNPSMRIIAVDMPSGLNADTGEVDTVTPCADYTVALGFPKPGLFAFPGAARVGKLAIVDIGIPERLAESVTKELVTAGWAKQVLPERPLDANKGTFGNVLVVAGSVNYIGAAYLACTGAMRVGAGLVTLATPAGLQPVLAAKLTEATYLPLPEAEAGIVSPQAAGVIAAQSRQYDALVVGCGLGQHPATVEFITSLLLREDLPGLVIDADALNALAGIPDWWQRLDKDAILTPHPGEMARLCGKTVKEVQQERLGAAEDLAVKWRKTIVLKGAYTVIAGPDGRSRINPAANPGMASAGTGDVLAGAIGGLLAQGMTPFDAASLGVYLHAEAGERVKARLGDAGMLASDLLPVLPLVIKGVKDGSGGSRCC